MCESLPINRYEASPTPGTTFGDGFLAAALRFTCLKAIFCAQAMVWVARARHPQDCMSYGEGRMFLVPDGRSAKVYFARVLAPTGSTVGRRLFGD